MKRAVIAWFILLLSTCVPVVVPTGDSSCTSQVVDFEEALAQHVSCATDADCVAGSIQPVPSYCCYASRRDWWEGEEMKALVSVARQRCGAVRYHCDRHICASQCESGQCRTVFTVK